MSGMHFLCLHHTVGGTISTWATGLQVGNRYVLSWSERDQPTQGSKTLIVTAGDSHATYDSIVLSPSHTVPDVWTRVEAPFAASASTMVFRFHDDGSDVNGSVYLDAIALRVSGRRPAPPHALPRVVAAARRGLPLANALPLAAPGRRPLTLPPLLPHTYRGCAMQTPLARVRHHGNSAVSLLLVRFQQRRLRGVLPLGLQRRRCGWDRSGVHRQRLDPTCEVLLGHTHRQLHQA